MKWTVFIVGLLLIVGHFLTEAYIIVWKLDDGSATTMIRPFKGKPEQTISVLWYMKFFFDELLWCITYATFAYVAKLYSKTLFTVICVFFFYHITDFFMYLYNYKDFRWLYVVMLGIDITAVCFMIFSKEKVTAKYKSIR